ncbi:MAG: superoxide dismutase, partial [Thalassospira sp.]|nr:superoxide dismutase [Thalassospira sp.]
MALELPALPYAYDALDPYMSAETLEFHHDKHHNAYVETGNKLLEGSGLEGKSLEELVVATYGDKDKAKLFNQVGQHWNHIEFWNMMKPNGGGNIPGELEKKIVEDFGSVDAFK